MLDWFNWFIAAIICIFIKHNYIPMNNFNYCTRCGHMEYPREKNTVEA